MFYDKVRKEQPKVFFLEKKTTIYPVTLQKLINYNIPKAA